MPRIAALAFVLLISLGTNLLCAPPPAKSLELPRLNWEPRSDWINVQKLGAKGDGRTDDSAALQKALSQLKPGATVYLPAGSYRITQSLKLKGPLIGVLVVGHGRDTVFTWDGPEGGQMFIVDGVAYSRYVGITFDGRGKAAVGFNHVSTVRFETEVLHQHLAFRNFTKVGLKAEKEDKYALAETTFDNCLFENCGHGTISTSFNDYNWTYDGCEFRNCGIGIECRHGNFYARNCHFQESKTVDVLAKPEHGCSLRRCTSLRSNQFLDFGNSVSPMTIQDCRIAGWKSKDGAVRLNGAPVLMFDCGFSNPPDAQPPLRVLSSVQRLMLSQNTATGSKDLVDAKASPHIYQIPAGKRKNSIDSAERSFFVTEARIPGKVFDAKRDFGAQAKPQVDDTAAVQRCIDAARKHGKGAIAYLPPGEYTIKQTLQISGADYFVGGTGFETRLQWQGPEGGTMVAVNKPEHVTLENIAIGDNARGNKTSQGIDVLQAASGSLTHMTYDGVTVFGMYQKKQPLTGGLHLKGLGPKEVVVLNRVNGNLQFIDAAQATVLARVTYEGAVTIEGKDPRRDGFTGFLSRLSTSGQYALHLKDNQNLVMSDFYIEQSDHGLLFEGSAQLPPGRATVCCSNMDLNNAPKDKKPPEGTALTIQDYTGKVFFGPVQFYAGLAESRISSTGTANPSVYVFSSLFYQTKLSVRGAMPDKVHLLANQAVGNVTAESVVTYQKTRDTAAKDSLANLSHALDDLRRLGDLDLALGHPTAK